MILLGCYTVHITHNLQTTFWTSSDGHVGGTRASPMGQNTCAQIKMSVDL